MLNVEQGTTNKILDIPLPQGIPLVKWVFGGSLGEELHGGVLCCERGA